MDSISSLAVIVSNYEALAPYEESYGMDNNIVNELSTFFVPRVVWKDKPVSIEPSAYGDLYFNYPENSFTMTPMGDLLRNFGPIGVPIGMLILGFLIRVIYAALIEGQPFSFWRSTVVLYADHQHLVRGDLRTHRPLPLEGSRHCVCGTPSRAADHRLHAAHSVPEQLNRWKRSFSPTGALTSSIPATSICFGGRRALGTRLIVGINSDESVRRIKGSGRPFMKQEDRMAVLKALESVDDVIIFDDLTPEKLIHEIKPDVLVKGGDWKTDEIVGADFVMAKGGEVHSLPAGRRLFIHGLPREDRSPDSK
jgi:rfaE bifunctional protein nucleotidyltransferase chain/domain